MSRPSLRVALLLAMALAFVAVCVVLSVVYRDTVERLVVLPLARLVWLGRMLAGAVGQVILWIGVILVLGVSGFSSFRSTRPPPPPREPGHPVAASRPEYWAGLIRRIRAGPSLRARLRTELGGLARSVLEQGSMPAAGETAVTLPPAVRSILGSEPEAAFGERGRRPEGSGGGDNLSQRAIEEIVSWMESGLGVRE